MLGRFFSRDHHYYISQGDKFLAMERYAEARNAFDEALAKMRGAEVEHASAIEEVKEKLALTGNKLALLNLAESEYAIECGELCKAKEHLHLVMELAEDVTTREKAENLLLQLSKGDSVSPVDSPAHGCNSCTGTAHKMTINSQVSDEHLSPADRYEVLIQTLPDDLPQRYAGLGEEFACAYLMAHGGDDEGALRTFEKLLFTGESDILLYEMALISYRRGDSVSCERHLRRSLELNGSNSLCWLALVQLKTDDGHYHEALSILQYMNDNGILGNQTGILAGDIHLMRGDEDQAISCYSQVLSSPAIARVAAEKLVPLLEQRGRSDEAKYLFDKYLKGCC
jgi:tetratricopeptide (TPR) repeat protein